jgi:hypothetical protein
MIKPTAQRALDEIEKGGKWNGKFYGNFIYVDGKKYQIDTNESMYLDSKDIFLREVSFLNGISLSNTNNTNRIENNTENNEFNNDQNPFLYMLHK